MVYASFLEFPVFCKIYRADKKSIGALIDLLAAKSVDPYPKGLIAKESDLHGANAINPRCGLSP
jgi:hypothetical protein